MSGSDGGTDLTGLKQRIDKLLRETNTYSQIRDFIRHQQSQENNNGEGSKKETTGSSTEAVHSALKEKHVLSQLVRSLRRPPNLADHGGHHSSDTHGLSALAAPSPFRRFLLLKVRGGRAFVDHTSTTTGNDSFVLHLHFRNQRFRSRPVPCSLEPGFDESFLMDLQSPDSTELVDLATLLAIDTKVHIVLTQLTEEGDSTKTTLVASYDVEWRRALVAGGVSIPAELLGAGPRSKMRHPVGVLDLRLDVVPTPSTEVPAADIDRGLRASEARSQDLNRQFFQYSRLWWKEFIEIDPAFKERLVKIFAEDVSLLFYCFVYYCVVFFPPFLF
jgi:centrosomal protein CEP76